MEGTRASSLLWSFAKSTGLWGELYVLHMELGVITSLPWSQHSMSSACRDPGVPSPVRTDSTSTVRTVSPVTASAPPVLVPSPPVLVFIPLALIYLFLAVTHANPLDIYFSSCYSENISSNNHACVVIESRASASYPPWETWMPQW